MLLPILMGAAVTLCRLFRPCLSIGLGWLCAALAFAQDTPHTATSQSHQSKSGCPPTPLPLEQQRAYVEQAPAKNAGFLWRIEKDNRTSWLYGTMHLASIDHAKPGNQVMQGMRRSDVLAVELNPYELQAGSPAPVANAYAWSEALLDRLAKALAQECIKVERAHLPLVGTLPLLASQGQRLGLRWGYSPDARLSQIAKRTSKPIVALETLEQQRNALAPKSQAEFETSVESSLASFESGAMQTELGQISRAWQTSDWQAMSQVEQEMIALQPAFATRILSERNLLMADKLDALHASGQRVFAAVGVLHMAGETGLPKLMRGKGYSVTYTPFTP
jgi:uncharacterized protein YbaP (TraB family)